MYSFILFLFSFLFFSLNIAQAELMPESHLLESKNIGIDQLIDIELFSPFAGFEIQTSRIRPLTIVPEDDFKREQFQKVAQKYSLHKKTMVVDNFLHGWVDKSADIGRFWTAMIPTEGVNDAILQVEWFDEGVGSHLQVRMKTDEPIFLVPQGYTFPEGWMGQIKDFREINDLSLLNQVDNPMFIPGDIVYSLFGARTKQSDSPWSPLQGILGEYAYIKTMYSTSHAADFHAGRAYVEQYKIHAFRQQKNQMLSKAIHFSAENGTNAIYHTVFNSCFTAALELLASVGLAVDTNIFNPYSVLTKLQQEAVIARERMISLGEEYDIKKFPQLRNEGNAETVEMLEELSPVLASDMFDQIIRRFSYVLLKDKWTHDELLQVFSIFKSIPKDQNSVAEIKAYVSDALAESSISPRKVQNLLSGLPWVFEDLTEIPHAGQIFNVLSQLRAD